MKPELVAWLVDPATGAPLELEALETAGDEIVRGILRGEAAYWYPVVDGVPRLLVGTLRKHDEEFRQVYGLPACPDPDPVPGATGGDDAGKVKTRETFDPKWEQFAGFAVGKPDQEAMYDAWYAAKLGVASVDELRAFLATQDHILEVGPGAGQKLRMTAQACPGMVVGADISAGADASYAAVRDLPNAHVVQADVFRLPFAEGVFDYAVSDGVLHHTPDTRAAFQAMLRHVAPGGEVLIHVYKRMGPVREFCDDHVREALMQLTPEECLRACEGITKVGQALSGVSGDLVIPEDVPVLGITAGTYSVQRFIYYAMFKCFWNDLFTFEENNMVNFDWYHPHHAWRHTEDEVVGWYTDAGLLNVRGTNPNPNGVAVRGSVPPA